MAFVSDGGQDRPPWPVKISGKALVIFVMIRERCARILTERGAVPETS